MCMYHTPLPGPRRPGGLDKKGSPQNMRSILRAIMNAWPFLFVAILMLSQLCISSSTTPVDTLKTGIVQSSKMYGAKKKRKFQGFGHNFNMEVAYNSTFSWLGNKGMHFTDFEDQAFAFLRQSYGVSHRDYLRAFQSTDSLKSFTTNSKSKQSFFFSKDGNFMVKTQKAYETETLIRILPELMDHFEKYPDSLINRFCGIYAVKPKGFFARPTYFVVTQNLLKTRLKISTIFDLKGSSVGRSATEKEKQKQCPVLKDNDLRAGAGGAPWAVGRRARRRLRRVLAADVAFLARSGLMDYSLLLGVAATTGKSSKTGLFHKVRRRLIAPILFIRNKYLVTLAPREVSHARYCTHEGEVLYLGLIDLLQSYTARKHLETWLKALARGGSAVGLSPVPPGQYADRMLAFIGGEAFRD